MMADEADLYLEEVFWRTVYFFKALLTCIGHGLHGESAGQRLVDGRLGRRQA